MRIVNSTGREGGREPCGQQWAPAQCLHMCHGDVYKSLSRSSTRYHRLPLPSEGAPMEDDFDAFVKILRVREHPVSHCDINHSTDSKERFVFPGLVPAGTNSPLQLLQPQFGRASHRRFIGGIGARHLDRLCETNGGGGGGGCDVLDLESRFLLTPDLSCLVFYRACVRHPSPAVMDASVVPKAGDWLATGIF